MIIYFRVYCLSGVSIVVDQKQPGEESVYFSLQFHIILQSQREMRIGTCRQELMERPWRHAAYWLVQSAFLYTPGPPVGARYHQ